MNEGRDQALNGDRRAMARLLSKIENGTLALSQLIDQPLETPAKEWKTMAITGAPGVGKSVLVDALMTAWASEGHKV
ncbi:MAG: methylmalonyl Co-A mutase-associated GTPase MeaB, partial [Poseidonia sp.]